MAMKVRVLVLGILVWLAGEALAASGFVGIYAIVDKVVFEPSEQAPERIQVWGSFMFLDEVDTRTQRGIASILRPRTGSAYTDAKRGYVYFRLPADPPSGGQDVITKEWADLKAVAGTGQAVGFGYWFYLGQFDDLRPGQTFPTTSSGNPLRVRAASEAPVNPTMYITNFGVVKLTEASHGPVVKALRDAR
jgi:hypothetical protein